MSDRSFRVLVLGATGLVGREIVSVLEEREFPVSKLFLYAAGDSDEAEGDLEFADRPREVQAMPDDPPEVDVAFLCATAEANERAGAILAARGTLTIDLEGGATGDDSRPLVLGPGDLAGASPNQPMRLAHPSARLLVAPLRALGETGTVRRVVATLVVPASAFGLEAVERLGSQTVALLNSRGGEEGEEEEEGPESTEDVRPVDDPTSLAFRCAPLGAPDEWVRGIRAQSERLLGGDVAVSLQAVKAPIFYGQLASISVELSAPLALDEVRKRLREAPSVILVEGDEVVRTTFDTLGIDAIQLSGLHQDVSSPQWIQFWAMAENVRQGAALPAVALAESLLLRH